MSRSSTTASCNARVTPGDWGDSSRRLLNLADLAVSARQLRRFRFRFRTDTKPSGNLDLEEVGLDAVSTYKASR